MCCSWSLWEKQFPVSRYFLRVSYGNTSSMCEICSNITIKTPDWRHWWRRCSGVFIVNFEQTSYIILVFPCWVWARKGRLGYWICVFLPDGFISFELIYSSFSIKNLGKLPKNYNPDVDPDPERWLPRWERSTFKHKKQKRGANTVGKIF